MDQYQTTVVMVGDVEHIDFAGATAWLSELGCESYPSCESATKRLADQQRWIDAILLFQSRPGRFSPAQIEGLHRVTPLAQLISLEGTWCEGQFRSGRPLPGVTRVYWHQWAQRLSRWLVARNETRPIWLRTSTLAEVLDQYAVIPAAANPALMAVACADVTTFDGMADVLQQLGNSAVWLPPRGRVRLAGVNGLLWCDRVDSVSDRRRLEQTRQLCGPCPTVAVLDFPRLDEIERLQRLGVSQVVSRPFSHSDLSEALKSSSIIGSSGLSASA